MLDFFYETDFEITDEESWKNWIIDAMNSEHKTVDQINYIFCSDDYLLDINIKYLQHDYYTDVIGFDSSEADNLMGDIFISIDRITDNAKQNKVSFENELARVIIHGILHFAGYKDKDIEDKKQMTEKENYYLTKAPLLSE